MLQPVSQGISSNLEHENFRIIVFLPVLQVLVKLVMSGFGFPFSTIETFSSKKRDEIFFPIMAKLKFP